MQDDFFPTLPELVWMLNRLAQISTPDIGMADEHREAIYEWIMTAEQAFYDDDDEDAWELPDGHVVYDPEAGYYGVPNYEFRHGWDVYRTTREDCDWLIETDNLRPDAAECELADLCDPAVNGWSFAEGARFARDGRTIPSTPGAEDGIPRQARDHHHGRCRHRQDHDYQG